MEQQLRAMLQAAFPDMDASRINWGEHPADLAGSYIVLHLIGLLEGHTQQGPDGLEQTRVQVDCYAPTYGQANGMGRAVKGLLNGYRSGGFRGIFFDQMRQTREGGDNSVSNAGRAAEAVYRASLDFIIHWRNQNAG